ncbi:MAG: hypothetical protein M1837_005079 [Sclerophora amabilis]|nr:MAG: hypothetical protein M1837_005079 [Sclerophora amabilis]
MALNMFGSGSNVVKLFEIRSPHVVILRGSSEEAASTEVHGTLVLCLSEPLSCKQIKLDINGTSRIGIPDMTGTLTPPRAKIFKEKSVFLHESRTFVDNTKTRAETLGAGNHEWQFSFIIEGKFPESVEGLRDSWVVYRMKATVERGRLVHDLFARKPLRIVRIPALSELEVAHDRFVERVWAGKIDYRFSVASNYQIFGSSVRVDLKIVPLSKTIKFGDIKISVMESQHYKVREHCSDMKREITSEIFRLEGGPQMINDSGQDGWQMPCVVNLPRILINCLQDVHVKGIKITHKVQVAVDILNEDGHVSEVIASFPINIYISPSFMVDESNRLSGPAPHNDQIRRQLESESAAPPRYEQRELDQLWSDLDPSLYTPAGGRSGVTSPLQSQSRNSLENLTSTHPSHAHAGHMVPPQLLSNRLQFVARTGNVGRRTAAPLDDDVSSSSASATAPTRNHSIPRRTGSRNVTGPRLSRRSPLGQPGTHHLEHVDDNLSKVPSYGTAVRSSTSNVISRDLPSYHTATRTPLSVPLVQRSANATVTCNDMRSEADPDSL